MLVALVPEEADGVPHALILLVHVVPFPGLQHKVLEEVPLLLDGLVACGVAVQLHQTTDREPPGGLAIESAAGDAALQA